MHVWKEKDNLYKTVELTFSSSKRIVGLLYVAAMNALNNINRVGEQTQVETRRVTDLEVFKQYRVCELKRIQTRYGARILCCLEDFNVFLPTRFARLTNGELEELNREPQLFMFYQGRADNNAAIIRFSTVDGEAGTQTVE